ncbi:MAG: phosphoribosyl-AMP cyclohydrolase [Acidobacteriota bacterium]
MAKKPPADITKKEVETAQKRWAAAIVDIGNVYMTGGDLVKCATGHIKDLYGYGDGPVLFKPTKCEQVQFRTTFKGALSYFIGNDFAQLGFNEDQGFAIAPFVAVRFRNADFIFEGAKRAIAMGNYFFTTPNGEYAKVEYTFGYRRRGDDLVIDLHHSSLPFSHG